MENCIKTGAYIHLVDYSRYAPADIFAVGGKRVVRFNGDIETESTFDPHRHVTHTLFLNNSENYWRKDIGIAVVDESDLLAVDLSQAQTNLKENV